MEKMKVLDSDKSRRPSKPVILTLGNFDGVHLGHQKLLKQVFDKDTDPGVRETAKRRLVELQ